MSDGTFLDVIVQPVVTVTGVVVKGGPNYNVYPGGLFADGSEDNLHAPLVGNDNIPMISHWFICGTRTTTTTTPSTTTSTTSTTTSTSTTGTSTTPVMTTTSSSGGGLPNTGTPASALALVAFALLVSGAGLMFLPGRLISSRKH